MCVNLFLIKDFGEHIWNVQENVIGHCCLIAHRHLHTCTASRNKLTCQLKFCRSFYGIPRALLESHCSSSKTPLGICIVDMKLTYTHFFIILYILFVVLRFWFILACFSCIHYCIGKF